VGVATETVRQVNERQLMNKYEGFLR